MNDLSTLATFLGWTLLLHMGFLFLAMLVLTTGKGFVISLQTKVLSISEEELNSLYIQFLTNYKLGIILLSFIPYVALKIMGY